MNLTPLLPARKRQLGYKKPNRLGMLGYVMPTVLRIDGLRVVIYTNDHRPAHIHVIGAAGEAVFFLNCPAGPPELRECYGFRQASLGRIQDAVADVLATLCDEWNRLHGND